MFHLLLLVRWFPLQGAGDLDSVVLHYFQKPPKMFWNLAAYTKKQRLRLVFDPAEIKKKMFPSTSELVFIANDT